MEWLSTGYWAAVAAATLFSMLLTWQAFEHRRYARSRRSTAWRRPRTGTLPCSSPARASTTIWTANLRPLFEQDHADYELVFIVESEHDPAAGTIRRMMHAISGHVQSRLVVAGHFDRQRSESPQPAGCHARICRRESSVLAFVDADVRPPRDWLRRSTSRLHKSPVTTGYRYFMPKRTTFANLVLASINGAVMPIMFPGKHHLIWGGSWAITREVFDASGLRDEWQGTLSDDLIATRVMARVQQRVVAEPMCILPSPLDVDCARHVQFRSAAVDHRSLLCAGALVRPAVRFERRCSWLLWGSLVAAHRRRLRGASWAWQPAAALACCMSLHWWRARLRHAASRLLLARHGRPN